MTPAFSRQLEQFHAVSCRRRRRRRLRPRLMFTGLRAHHFYCGPVRTHIFIYFETYFVSSILASTPCFPHTYYSYAPLNLCFGQFFIASVALFFVWLRTRSTFPHIFIVN